MASRVAQFQKLYTGARMPALGLGTFFSDSTDAMVDDALRIGYRHIDTARSYRNEAAIGKVLTEHFNKGTLKREDLFLTTKVPSNSIGSEKDILDSAEGSLEDLKTKYVDLLLIHMPFGYVPGPDRDEMKRTMVHYDIVAAWRAMEKIFKKGYAKAIGISNFTEKQILRISENAEIKPAILQLECHAYQQQRELREFCAKRGMVVTAYSPIGAPGRPSWMQLEGDKILLNDPVVQEVAKSVGRTEAQVLLRFLIQNGVVPLPKSASPERLQQNLEALTGDFNLDEGMTQKLKNLQCNQKYFRFIWAHSHPEYFGDEPY